MTKEHEKKNHFRPFFSNSSAFSETIHRESHARKNKNKKVKNHAPNYLRNSKFSPLLHFSLLSNTNINPKESEPKNTKQTKNAFTIN
jgi:hypothetical protein